MVSGKYSFDQFFLATKMNECRQVYIQRRPISYWGKLLPSAIGLECLFYFLLYSFAREILDTCVSCQVKNGISDGDNFRAS